MSLLKSLIACTSFEDLSSLLNASPRNDIIDALLDYKKEFQSAEYIGQHSFYSERTQSITNQIASLPSCYHVKYLLMSLIGDPELHWRLCSKIIPSFFWYYKSLAPNNTTISKVNNIGLDIARHFSIPLDREYLYSNFSSVLPSDITSPAYLAALSLMPSQVICSLWSERFESQITFLSSYYSNLFPEKPAFFPPPFFNIYDFSVKRLLPSWGASMAQDSDSLGPFLVSLILSSYKITVRDSSVKLPGFLISSTISNLVEFK